mgnify:CR=1 FL=1
MDYRQEYDKWCNDPYFDDQTREELKAIAGDDKEIEDRFYRTLEFGTAGLRGNQSYEYLHGPSGDTGTGKLYSGTGRTGERCGNRT